MPRIKIIYINDYVEDPDGNLSRVIQTDNESWDTVTDKELQELQQGFWRIRDHLTLRNALQWTPHLIVQQDTSVLSLKDILVLVREYEKKAQEASTKEFLRAQAAKEKREKRAKTKAEREKDRELKKLAELKAKYGE